MDPDVVAGYHLSSGSSKILRSEASIIPNDQAFFSEAGLLEIFRYCLSTDAYIVKGEILSDNPSPPIRAKFNWIGHNNLVAQLYS
jgi:hypothetical protein